MKRGYPREPKDGKESFKGFREREIDSLQKKFEGLKVLLNRKLHKLPKENEGKRATVEYCLKLITQSLEELPGFRLNRNLDLNVFAERLEEINDRVMKRPPLAAIGRFIENSSSVRKDEIQQPVEQEKIDKKQIIDQLSRSVKVLSEIRQGNYFDKYPDAGDKLVRHLTILQALLETVEMHGKLPPGTSLDELKNKTAEIQKEWFDRINEIS